jgi:hypothetical protein
MRKIVRAAAVSVCLFLFLVPAGATVLRGTMTLDATTAEADRIVHGTVGDVRVGTDENGLPATWITFDVARTLKGASDRRVSVKQFGNCDANSASAVGRVPDLPRYSFRRGSRRLLAPRERTRLHEPGRIRRLASIAWEATRAGAWVRNGAGTTRPTSIGYWIA